MSSHKHTGKIKIQKPNSKRCLKSIEYSFDCSHKCQFKDNLLSNFEYLGLSPMEKQYLTFEMRNELLAYQKMEETEIQSFMKALCSELKSAGEKKLIIKASGLGAFICLHALAQKDFCKHTDIEFHFEDAPLKLFPLKLCKKVNKKKNVKIYNSIDHQSWLAEFEGLYTNTELIPTTAKRSFKRAA